MPYILLSCLNLTLSSYYSVSVSFGSEILNFLLILLMFRSVESDISLLPHPTRLITVLTSASPTDEIKLLCSDYG